jgi:uncharacterized UPF0160 family protein
MKKITTELIKNAKVAYTHAGVFHADDVFSSALLKLINPDIRIIRTFNVKDLDEDEIVFDIGGGIYDHHGTQEFRENPESKPYAAFGKLWRDLGESLVGKESAAAIDDALVSDIDATDNLGQAMHPNALSAVIAILNPSWKENGKADEYFGKAVRIAEKILNSYINKEIFKKEAIEIVKDSPVTPSGILMLEKFVPWKGYVQDKNMEVINLEKYNTRGEKYAKCIKMAIYPSQRGGWNLEAVPSEDGSLIVNLSDAKESDGNTFVHNSGFLASFVSRESALSCGETLIRNMQ